MSSFLILVLCTYNFNKGVPLSLYLWLWLPIIGGYLIDWSIDIKDAKKERIKELKITIKEYIRFDLEIPSLWGMTFAYNYYYYRCIYYKFKEFEEQEKQENLIVNILSEIKTQPIHPFIEVDTLKLQNKKEQIGKYIFSDIPIFLFVKVMVVS